MQLGPDFSLLAKLSAMGLKTPLIYAGGIRNVEDGVKLIQIGADRIVIDALLQYDLPTVRGLAKHLGAQAVIASLPLSINGSNLAWLDYRSRKSSAITEDLLSLIGSGLISEVLISDWEHEGMPSKFEQQLIEKFPIKHAPIIAFGGISEQEQMCSLIQSPLVSAVAVGNFLSYKEHAVQSYKELLLGMPVRLATYESTYSLISDVKY